MPDVRIDYQAVGKKFFNSPSNEGDPTFIEAVRNVSLNVQEGEVVSLIGPSGCGKSTLLNMGSGLYQPTEGQVFLDGELVKGPSPDVGFMLQKDLLLPWRTIRRNVEFGLEILNVPTKLRLERSGELFNKCRLEGFEDHYPHQLSGGMRQRAALARTLAVDPKVLLMDEPFSALDAQTKMILQQDLAETLASENKTALFITHDLTESATLSDRIFVMSQRPGTIIKEIKVELPNRDNPMARRQETQRELSLYVTQLMELLQIGDMIEEVEV